MEIISLPTKETNISHNIADLAGHSQPHQPSVIELKFKGKANGQTSMSLHKFLFLVKHLMMVATEVMPETLMNGFITTTSPMKHAHHIKLKDMTMVLDVLLK